MEIKAEKKTFKKHAKGSWKEVIPDDEWEENEQRQSKVVRL